MKNVDCSKKADKKMKLFISYYTGGKYTKG